MNTKNTRLYKKISYWFFSFLWLAPVARAQTVTTTLLTSPSTLKQTGIDASSLPSLLGTVFNLGIAIAVVLALIMIIIGGIQYMTTDAWTKKEEGRQRITDALLGLGLALVSWLLLDIINPTLVTFCGNLLVGKSC